MTVPKRYEHATTGNYVVSCDAQRDTLNDIEAWGQHVVRDGGYGNLVLLGNPGTGKGHLGCAVLKLYVRAMEAKRQETARHEAHFAQPVRAEYTTAADLLRSLTDTFGGEGSSRTVLKRYKAADLLVIDEIGVGSNTDFAKDTLCEIIDARSLNLKPTIAISNLDKDELKNYLDGRAMDRLTEGFSFTLPFTWESYRKRGRDSVAKDKHAPGAKVIGLDGKPVA